MHIHWNLRNAVLAIGKRHLGYAFNDQQHDLDDLVVQIPMLNPM